MPAGFDAHHRVVHQLGLDCVHRARHIRLGNQQIDLRKHFDVAFDRIGGAADGARELFEHTLHFAFFLETQGAHVVVVVQRG